MSGGSANSAATILMRRIRLVLALSMLAGALLYALAISSGFSMRALAFQCAQGLHQATTTQSCKGRGWVIANIKKEMPGASVTSLPPVCYVPLFARLPRQDPLPNALPDTLVALVPARGGTVRLLAFRGECHFWSGFLSPPQHQTIMQAIGKGNCQLTARA